MNWFINTMLRFDTRNEIESHVLLNYRNDSEALMSVMNRMNTIYTDSYMSCRDSSCLIINLELNVNMIVEQHEQQSTDD